MNRNLIYGEWSTGLVFMDVDDVEERVALFKALGEARTWGEFERRISCWRYDEIIERMSYASDGDRDGWISFDEFLQETDTFPTNNAERQVARRAYELVDLRDRGPIQTDPFDAEVIPGYQESGWPEWPAQQMLHWIPIPVQERFGLLGVTRISGDFLALPTEQEAAIVAVMTEAGYVCRRDEAAIEAAHGV